jgi:hypothetical protein
MDAVIARLQNALETPSFTPLKPLHLPIAAQCLSHGPDDRFIGLFVLEAPPVFQVPEAGTQKDHFAVHECV